MLNLKRRVKGRDVDVTFARSGAGTVVTVAEADPLPGSAPLVSPVLPVDLTGAQLNWVADLATWRPAAAVPAPEAEIERRRLLLSIAVLSYADVGGPEAWDALEMAILEWALARGWSVLP
jgi:hypothetical protein